MNQFKDKISLLKNRGITYQKYFELQKEIDDDKLNNIDFFKNVYKIRYMLKLFKIRI